MTLGAALFSSGSVEWETPQDLFDRLNAIHRFTLDVCATDANAKCARYFTREQDGLQQSWAGEVCWMNPPYGREIASWMEKAYRSAQEGATVVCLLPARTDTDWMHRFVLPFAGINARAKEHAWAAGIVDGEGCIHIRKNEPSDTSKHRSVLFDLVVKVAMTDRGTVERLHQIFRVGSVTVDEKKPAGHKTAYIWTCRTADAVQVLQCLYPFLLTKRHEAFRGLEFSLLKGARGGKARVPQDLTDARRAFYDELRALKKGPKTFVAPHVSVEFIRGRLRFGGHKNSAPFPSAIVVFGAP